jgi:hypothetical protein
VSESWRLTPQIGLRHTLGLEGATQVDVELYGETIVLDQRWCSAARIRKPTHQSTEVFSPEPTQAPVSAGFSR